MNHKENCLGTFLLILRKKNIFNNNNNKDL